MIIKIGTTVLVYYNIFRVLTLRYFLKNPKMLRQLSAAIKSSLVGLTRLFVWPHTAALIEPSKQEPNLPNHQTKTTD